jgi:hypothetical protein
LISSVLSVVIPRHYNTPLISCQRAELQPSVVSIQPTARLSADA